MAWYIRFLQKALEQRSSTDGEQVHNLTSERIRAARAQTSRFELENAKRRGEVVSVPYVAGFFMRIGAELTSRLESLPGRIQTQLKSVIDDPAKTRELLLRECRLIRNSLADAVREFTESNPAPPDAGDDAPAPAAKKRNRVGRRVSRTARGH
jgi:phage terminase Nu1 subunit (DNA packaging protein)